MLRFESVRRILDVAAVVLVIVTASFALTRLVRTGSTGSSVARRAEPPLPNDAIQISTLWGKGSVDARTGLLVLADFECPACGHFAGVSLPVLERDYVETGKTRLVFGHRPLPQHSRAIAAGAAAECAGDSGRFWEMHDLLFRNQKALADLSLTEYAVSLGVPKKKFGDCLKGAEKRVAVGAAQFAGIELRGTPSIFVGRVNKGALRVTARWTGSPQPAVITKALDEILSIEKNP